MGRMKTEPKVELVDSWLVQRLHRPREKKPLVIPEGFDYVKEMLSDNKSRPEATKVRQQIYELDYMGSSEFEWGAIPTALKKIASEHQDYGCFSMSVNFADIEPPFRYKNELPVDYKFNVYVICRRDQKKLTEERIRSLVKGMRLKEGLYFAHGVVANGLAKEGKNLGDWEWQERQVGWLELNNNFFFFIDQTMFKGVAKLFHVEGK